MTTRPNPEAPIVTTSPHEMRANLNFAAGGLTDNMAPYWALCKFIRQFDGGATIETEIPWTVDPHPVAEADVDDEEPQEDVEISLYYGTDDEGNPAGKIAPHPEFDLSQDRGMWEPRISVDGVGERKASFHIRPRYAEMTHVDTGDAISSPFDHDDQPDRGFNVNIQGSNLEPEEYVHYLREACSALADELGENWSSEHFARPLETSNIVQFERYLRLSRGLAQKLTRMGGSFHQLAMLLSDQDGTKGAYFWDNEDVQGYMHRLLADEASVHALIPGHEFGSQLKTYHPEHVHSDPSDPLYHPKFGALFTKRMSGQLLNSGSCPWSRHQELSRELEERITNVLAWAGVPIDPHGLGASNDDVGAYVDDWHYRAQPTERDIDLSADPTPEIERSQESMIVRAFQRMTGSGLDLSEQLIADGGHARYDKLAESAEVSESTVYRWLRRMGDAVEADNGVITFASANLREQFEEILNRTVTSVKHAVDNAVRAADSVLEEDAYQRAVGDPFESWREKWGAEILDDADALELGTCLPHPENDLDAPVDAGDVIKEGFDAWREVGRGNGEFPSEVRWQDDRDRHHREDINDLLEAAKRDIVSEAVAELAQRAFAGKDVVDAITQVKRMIDGGSSWSAAQIQAAVEEAGFDIDIEDYAEPDFEIPETPG